MDQLQADTDHGEDAAVGSLAWALGCPPSAAVVSVLAEVDPFELSGDQRVDLIKAWERVESWVAARHHAALSVWRRPLPASAGAHESPR